ncbi:hypothetical protein GOE08_17110, partial [Sinorhizobium medicae]|nr:hypothetical protein [Sinorhizobium medicae]
MTLASIIRAGFVKELAHPAHDIEVEVTDDDVELPPKDRTCSGLRFRADELAWRLI